MKRRRVVTVAALSALPLIAHSNPARADSYLPGGLVLMTVGNANFNIGGGDAVSFQEIDPSTGLAIANTPTFSLDTSGGDAISESSLTNHDRHLYRSSDGHYLSFAGYNTAPGAIDPAVFAATTAPRVIGLINST